MVQGFLDRAETSSAATPKAIIVPHAGYVYSGAIAASGYAQVHPDDIKRVILLGPAHRVLFEGLAVPEVLIWRTPLGDVRIDMEAILSLSLMPQITFSDKAHQDEHSLEVQLPFLQEWLGDFKLTPLLVGNSSVGEVAAVLAGLWGGPETLIVISSDLSHYESYEKAAEKDKGAAQAIVDLDVRGLDYDNACGLLPIAGLIHQAQQRRMRAELLDLRSSGDTAGPRDQVVGYGAFAFYE